MGNVTARLASFIVGTSAIFLTTIGLIGGPEVISILFVLFALYLLLVGTKSNKKVLWFIAALSSFVIWQAWDFNFYTFIGLLICSTAFFAGLKKESLKTNIMVSLLLFACLLVDDRLTSNFTLEKFGFPVPLLSMVVIPIIFIFSIKKNLKIPKLFLIIVTTLVALDFTFLSVVLTSPESRYFQTTLVNGVTNANVALNGDIISRAFQVGNISYYSSIYANGLIAFLGQVIIFLSLLSLVRLTKIKKTLVLISFPLCNLLLWIFFDTFSFQPRYIFGVSIFYDILAASAIIYIARSATNIVLLNKIVEYTKIKTPQRISIKKLIALMIVVLMLTSYFVLNFAAYNNGEQTDQNWNFLQVFGWSHAINWITSNTSSSDRIAAVYGDYFSWYTNRQTAFLYPISNKTTLGLIDLIRTLQIKYLIVDQTFETQFTDLSVLYNSPSPFLGSPIVFMSQTNSNTNVIIYNVTNIAYGKLVNYIFEPDWTNLQNWQSLSYYGTSNISKDQNSIRIDSVPIEQSSTGAAASLNLGSFTDLSNFTTFNFWVKVPKSGPIVVEIYSGQNGQNYYSYGIKNDVFDNWTQISVPLAGYAASIGNPDLQNGIKINFILTGVPTGNATSFWIRNPQFSEQEYVLENSTS